MANEIEMLKKIILYISYICKDKPNFGATHLNKILYFVDFIHFKMAGKSITGAEYFKLERGPAPRLLVPAREELIASGELKIEDRQLPGNYSQKRPVAVNSIDESFLEGYQIALIKEIADIACGTTATVLSELSHKHLAWELADLKEPIPYFTIHCTKINPITASSKNWAINLLKKRREAA